MVQPVAAKAICPAQAARACFTASQLSSFDGFAPGPLWIGRRVSALGLNKARGAIAALIVALLVAAPALADSLAPRAGWSVHDTDLAYDTLIARVQDAVKAEGMFVVTQAGPTKAAANRGIEIPGNRVIGVYNNDYAVRTIRLSVPAMIEAPIRFYVTEDSDGTATLSYKTPSFVFAPYFDEGGADLKALAAELDKKFSAIAARSIDK